MSGCHTESSNQLIDFISFFGIEGGILAFSLTMFLTGLTSSFTHCIMMCGPIAMTQMSMRLMHLPKEKMNEWSRMQCAFAIPYYLGKATTYSLLVALMMSLNQAFYDIYTYRVLAGTVFIITGMLFMYSGMNHNFSFIQIKLPFKRYFDKLISTANRKLSLTPYGIKGFILGMVLGMMPCGIVYAAALTIVANTINVLVAMVVMFIFGIATIPGLFIISLLGESVMSRFKSLFATFYLVMMLINAYLLIMSGISMFPH
jgi:sulfite exporter TauE/SafE